MTLYSASSSDSPFSRCVNRPVQQLPKGLKQTGLQAAEPCRHAWQPWSPLEEALLAVCRADITSLPQVALLCGPPGLGKTTLAHVIAKHAGYNAVEMNARCVCPAQASPRSWRRWWRGGGGGMAEVVAWRR